MFIVHDLGHDDDGRDAADELGPDLTPEEKEELRIIREYEETPHVVDDELVVVDGDVDDFTDFTHEASIKDARRAISFLHGHDAPTACGNLGRATLGSAFDLSTQKPKPLTLHPKPLSVTRNHLAKILSP